MNKKYIMQTSILISVVCGMAFYLFTSKRGIYEYAQLCKEIKSEQKNINQLKHQVANLETHIKQWQTDPLETEKCCRQDLLMGYTDERVYLLADQKPMATTDLKLDFFVSSTQPLV